ncbi:MAG: glycosyltransferase family 4 protein [Moorea sp. SIO4A3]|nr:glycosyltransferase family 4 protein [Moorena sp. SIO4A3]
MNRPLKILMVLHMPWTRNLGGSRVQLELAEEFRAMGHVVEKFDYHDAFPNASSSRLAQLTRPHFSVKARAFVKANAHRFDIIDAHQGNLPFSKQELGFQGLLVARSVGLYAFYDQFAKQEQEKYPPQKIKTRLGNLLRSWQYRRISPRYPRSLHTCDLINLCNHDELTYVSDVMRLGEKSVVFPFGLSSKRQQEFLKTVKPAEVRLVNKQVVFIGSWGRRKGSRDWRNIIMRVREQVPGVRFLFLGTGSNAEVVLEDLGIPKCDWIEIIPRYDSEELPKLLSGATVGAFPSYIEGFPFAVLEKLACGLPTVAYDVPGARETLRLLDRSLLIPPGNIQEFSSKLTNLLLLDKVDYFQFYKRCIEIAKKFYWNKIANNTLDVYSKFL